jgi:hypothetical protein
MGTNPDSDSKSLWRRHDSQLNEEPGNIQDSFARYQLIALNLIKRNKGTNDGLSGGRDTQKLARVNTYTVSEKVLGKQTCELSPARDNVFSTRVIVLGN